MQTFNYFGAACSLFFFSAFKLQCLFSWNCVCNLIFFTRVCVCVCKRKLVSLCDLGRPLENPHFLSNGFLAHCAHSHWQWFVCTRAICIPMCAYLVHKCVARADKPCSPLSSARVCVNKFVFSNWPGTRREQRSLFCNGLF